MTSPTGSVQTGVTSPTSSLASGMVSPLDRPSSGMTSRTLTSMENITSLENVTSPTQKGSSGVTSPGYSSGMTSPANRYSADVSVMRGKEKKVLSPTQRHSADITFGTCYGPPPKKSSGSTSSTSEVTSPTRKSPLEKSPPGAAPTQRFMHKDVLSPTQVAVQVRHHPWDKNFLLGWVQANLQNHCVVSLLDIEFHSAKSVIVDSHTSVCKQ